MQRRQEAHSVSVIWYYARDRKRLEPFTYEHLRELGGSGSRTVVHRHAGENGEMAEAAGDRALAEVGTRGVAVIHDRRASGVLTGRRPVGFQGLLERRVSGPVRHCGYRSLRPTSRRG